MSQKIIIVDNEDSFIGHKKRGTLNTDDIYRVSALWIKNSKGEILLAQRSFNKNHHPGIWMLAVAGTVDEGETYEANIIKEAEEELGLKNLSIKKELETKNNGKYKHFTQWFPAIVDKEIFKLKMRIEEVEKIKLLSKEELLRLEEKPDKFFESTLFCIKNL